MVRANLPYPPFSVLAKHLSRDEDFLADVQIILDLNTSKYSKLVTALASDESFLDSRKLTRLVQSVFKTAEEASKLAKIIQRFHKFLCENSDESPEQSLAMLCSALSEDTSKISSEDCAKLAKRIKDLVFVPQSLARQQKAEELAEATGIDIKDLQLICDIRPIFNDERSTIEGAIPISILKIDFSEPDGSVSRMEFSLTEEQILILCTKTQLAKNKISAIKRFLVEKEIKLPATSVTINEKESR
jgi:hypothetical protein